MAQPDIQTLIEDATLDYAQRHRAALAKLDRATTLRPIPSKRPRRDQFSCAASMPPPRRQPSRCGFDDLFIHTTLSRIFMEKGDRATAEVRRPRQVLGWKNQLQNPADHAAGPAS